FVHRIGIGRKSAQIYAQRRAAIREENGHACAYQIMQFLFTVYILGLQLAGTELACDRLRRVGHHLLRREGDAALQNRKEDDEEEWRQHNEFDGDRPFLLATEADEERARRKAHPA